MTPDICFGAQTAQRTAALRSCRANHVAKWRAVNGIRSAVGETTARRKEKGIMEWTQARGVFGANDLLGVEKLFRMYIIHALVPLDGYCMLLQPG